MGNTAPATGRGRILVVEDDPTAARFAAYVLGERGGFDVTHVTDPVVAIQRVADEHWDLVLADLDLPHMSGLDLLASVRRIAPGLPVVMTTAMAMEAARRTCPAFARRRVPREADRVAAAHHGHHQPHR